MADKILKHDDMEVVRFACSCFDAGHSMTVSIEKFKDAGPFCLFELHLEGRASLFWRIKQAWKALKGKDGCLGDFDLRLEDGPVLATFLAQLAHNPNTE